MVSLPLYVYGSPLVPRIHEPSHASPNKSLQRVGFHKCWRAGAQALYGQQQRARAPLNCGVPPLYFR